MNADGMVSGDVPAISGMTLADAQKVAAVVATADGGCPRCARELTELLAEHFPAFAWEYDGVKGEVLVTPRADPPKK